MAHLGFVCDSIDKEFADHVDGQVQRCSFSFAFFSVLRKFFVYAVKVGMCAAIEDGA